MPLLALDEGTTSTRAVILSEDGRTLASAAQEFTQHFPAAGLVEHDAAEVWRTSREVIGRALGKAQVTSADIHAIGITNQRETTVVWDKATGQPVHPAIVWQDTRGSEQIARLNEHADEIRELTGLPVASYFSAIKLMWLLDNVPGLRDRAAAGEVLFGTMDTWLVWNLSGGSHGGQHVTDVTNASRTMLLDLAQLDWSDRLLDITGVPRAMLPEVVPSIGEFAQVAAGQLLAGVPITGVLGDQQAALFGHRCFSTGMTKNSYGTGCFILTNTGEDITHSQSGLITTVAFQQAGQPARYALEGSIAVAGSLVHWLRDGLGLISSSEEVEQLATTVADTGDVYIVPAFSGLFAPHWRPDARGVIVGLTRFTTKAHIARAALEATAFQTAEVIAAIRTDTGQPITEVFADGGMSVNDGLMQFQADLLAARIRRPAEVESTAIGAGLAAGLGAGVYGSLAEISELELQLTDFDPDLPDDQRRQRLHRWSQAVERSLSWV